jgi:hypothetical protein
MSLKKWYPIKGYEDLYEITTTGEIKGIDRIIIHSNGKRQFIKGRNIKVRKNNFGYFDTRLYKNGEKKSAFVHRLLAETFIPNPLNLPYVNHRNGIKSDNRIENLEWVSASGNAKHAYDMGLYKRPHQSHRKVIDTCTGQLYNSIREAAKANDIPYGSCKNLLNGVKKNTTCLQFAV